MSPDFLDLEDILQIQQAGLDDFGGSPGIRDLGAINAALAMPQSGFGDHYFHEDLAAMAAAYLFHLAQNHGFIDGNKRVALASCRYFLGLNGKTMKATGKELLKMTMDTASGKLKKDEIATFIRKHI